MQFNPMQGDGSNHPSEHQGAPGPHQPLLSIPGAEDDPFTRPRSLSIEMSLGTVGRMSRSGSTTSMEEADDPSDDLTLFRRRRRPTEALHLPNLDITDKISRRMSLTENPSPPTLSRIHQLREKERRQIDPEYEVTTSLIKSVSERLDPDVPTRANFVPLEPSKLRSIPISDPIGIAGTPNSPRFTSPMRTRSRSPSPVTSPSGSPRSPSFVSSYPSQAVRLKRRLSEDRYEPYHKRLEISYSPSSKHRLPHNPFLPGQGLASPSAMVMSPIRSGSNSSNSMSDSDTEMQTDRKAFTSSPSSSFLNPNMIPSLSFAGLTQSPIKPPGLQQLAEEHIYHLPVLHEFPSNPAPTPTPTPTPMVNQQPTLSGKWKSRKMRE